MFQPREQLRLMRRLCLPSWSSAQLSVVALAALAATDTQIAGALFITERSVRRHIHEACARVFESSEISATREALVAWFWLHSNCCTAGALHLVETEAHWGARNSSFDGRNRAQPSH